MLRGYALRAAATHRVLVLAQQHTARVCVFTAKHSTRHTVRQAASLPSPSWWRSLLDSPVPDVLSRSILLARSALRRRIAPLPPSAGGKGKNPSGAPHESPSSSSSAESSRTAQMRSGMRAGERGQQQQQQPQPPMTWRELIAPILFLIALHYATPGQPQQTYREITWQEFYRLMLRTGEVSKLVIDMSHERAHVYLHEGAVIEGYSTSPRSRLPHFEIAVPSLETFEHQLQIAQEELGIPSSEWVPVIYMRHDDWSEVLLAFFPVLLTIGVWAYFSRRAAGMRPPVRPPTAGGRTGRRGKSGLFDEAADDSPLSVGKIKPYIVPKGGEKTTFKDVAGLTEAKVEVQEFVSFLHQPEKFQTLGAKVPKGALLVGPPGTGKTLLAKAVAGEAKVPFFAVSGSDFVEMFVGVGPARVRDLFRQAREAAPCIIYIDEIDAIGKARSGDRSRMSGGHNERESTLNQLLVEMDGFSSRDGVLIMASTNRADMLDKALLRPGRFDRQIHCDLPSMEERKDLFRVYLRKIRLLAQVGEAKVLAEPTLEHVMGITRDKTLRKPAVLKDAATEQLLDQLLDQLASLTPGMSGAQIANVCNEAALIAGRKGSKSVSEEDLYAAIDRVVGGIEKKNRVMSQEERRMVAYHEAGHALLSWLLKYTDPVIKVSIIPRGSSSLGHTQMMSLDNKLHSREMLFERMVAMLGGRAAEQVVFESITTSAQDDIKRVTDIAYNQISRFGMSEKIGPLVYERPAPNQGRKRFSQAVSVALDNEAKRLVHDAYDKALEMIQERRDDLVKLAEHLLKKEVLLSDDVKAILGPRPLGPQPPYKFNSVEEVDIVHSHDDEKKARRQQESQKSSELKPSKEDSL